MGAALSVLRLSTGKVSTVPVGKSAGMLLELLELLGHANACAAQYSSLHVLAGQSGQLLPCGQSKVIPVLELEDELGLATTELDETGVGSGVSPSALPPPPPHACNTKTAATKNIFLTNIKTPINYCLP
jgi:ABC-type molybdate transport system substrate-binding protein